MTRDRFFNACEVACSYARTWRFDDSQLAVEDAMRLAYAHKAEIGRLDVRAHLNHALRVFAFEHRQYMQSLDGRATARARCAKIFHLNTRKESA